MQSLNRSGAFAPKEKQVKLAAARAGVAFFGTIIFILVAMPSTLKGMSLGDGLRTLVFFAFIVAGMTFFWNWHTVAQEDRELTLAERRQALKDAESGNRS